MTDFIDIMGKMQTTGEDVYPSSKAFVQDVASNFDAAKTKLDSDLEVRLSGVESKVGQVTESVEGGVQIDAGAIASMPIAKIVDDATYAKMTVEEKAFIDATMSDQASLSHLKLKLSDGTVIDGTVELVQGNLIKITPLRGLGSSGEVRLKIDSLIPAMYFRLHRYSVVPRRVNNLDPYRYKVSDVPYVVGSLRVYVNTHRIPDRSIRQDRATMGEFDFDRSIEISELPKDSADDIICCDFEVPVLQGETSVDDRTWYGDYMNVPFMQYAMPEPGRPTYEAFRIPSPSGVQIGDWIGIADSGSLVPGRIERLDVRAVGEVGCAPDPDQGVGTASALRPMGVVVAIVGDQAVIAYSGLIDESVFATDSVAHPLASAAGKTFFVDKDFLAKRGRMAASDATGADFTTISVNESYPITGLYKLPVGECVSVNSQNYLMIRIGQAEFKSIPV